MDTRTINWYLQSKEEIFSSLKTSKKGLSTNEAEERLKLGRNVLADEEKGKLFKILLKNFNNLLIYVLFGSAMISLISDHFLEFYVIIVIIALTGFLGFYQEFRAGKSLEALKKLTSKKVDVIRDGRIKIVDAELLVKGDIIVLRRGMIAPADIRVIENRSLIMNESVLTGESVQKPKISKKISSQNLQIGDQQNMVFGGTSITKGKGLGIIVATGITSEIGKISQELKDIGETKSPLQIKINKMSQVIAYAVLAISAILYFIMSIKGVNTFEALIIVGAVAVAGIPESFPLALTLALSNGIKKMAKSNAVIRDLNSVETLGTTTVICTDKTGTLTQNKMVVDRLFFADGTEVHVKGNGYSPDIGFITDNHVADKNYFQKFESFFNACILCNDAETFMENNLWVLKGEPTEGALLTVAKGAGFNDLEIRKKCTLKYEVPFDPSKKYMVSVQALQKTCFAHLKGSVEQVTSMSGFIRTKRGIRKMTSADVKKINNKACKYSEEGFRVLAVGSKNLKNTMNFSKNVDKGFIFEGLAIIRDPVRPDVFKSIAECKRAGIRVIMITGDHKVTAESIGKSLGILEEGKGTIVEGHILDGMDDESLDNIVDNISIFARSTPEHKLRIVSSLQRKGEIVAMTGDGVNDAPALKKADIGISMGKEGTDVAREASNMVLTDDNFSTIVSAVKEGRTIYSNIRRFIFYLLTGNITEVGIIGLSIIIGLISPLSALMILFINLVTSTFPAVALSVEPTHYKVMRQKPRSPKENLLSRYILLKILVLVPIIFLGTLLIFQLEFQATNSIEKARTVAFATLIVFELMHSFNARSLHTSIFNRGFFRSKKLFLAIAGSFGLTLLAIYTNAGQKIFGTVALSYFEWITIFAFGFSIVLISEVIKLQIKSEFEEQMHLKGLKIKLE